MKQILKDLLQTWMPNMNDQAKEVRQGERFEFGKNWQRFLSKLNEDRILEAEKSLKQMLEIDDLKGKSFLDIGSGSGLFSLAARRLGAKVHCFDYDALSIACTKELKNRFFGNDLNWTIEQGNVLDKNYLGSLGQFDIVYAWGVLHHTGSMWQALENVEPLVAEGGKLYISIYNNQGAASLFWTSLKKFYNRSSRPVKGLIVLAVGAYWETRSALSRLLRGKNPLLFERWAGRKKDRGMSVWHDLVDWVGGYPFEVAKPEEIFDFYRRKRFELIKLKTCAGEIGCNEYVFVKRKNLKAT
jgi:2-polyprenyl-3-methyl-5-hydroxy-6-metoxy-1,4-benzoquinol methylase